MGDHVALYRRWPWLLGALTAVCALLVALAGVAAAQDQTERSTVEAVAADDSAEPTAPVTETQTLTFLPILFRPLEPPTMSQPTRPNAANSWTVSWQPLNGVASYTLQEAIEPTFANPTVINTGGVSQAITRPPSFNNEYFYRARGVAADGTVGPWSAVVSVVGAYRDDFNDDTSGWAMRRTTYLEKVRNFYETPQSWYVIQVEDKWDWGLFAPMKKAPTIPYAIEYRVRPPHIGNLLSHSAVYAGDWNGEPCIDFSSFEGIYLGTNCFNHFYNPNLIMAPPFLKLQWERVDRLVWCPTCDGSPMKRLSDDEAGWPRVQPVPNMVLADWTTFRIEVRANGSTMFVNGQQFASYSSTRWLEDRYFGLFASTDEYNNSTWRIDYYQVTPLDQ